ncbi:four-helix bundle copper-binding protein [Clostridium hydrogenum]
MFSNVCSIVCDKCATECSVFQDQHCKVCADTCRQCSNECRTMASK